MGIKNIMGAVNHSLLDVYHGAVFSVSLRLLRNNYTGNCIRVRRSSDDTEQDIGFNVNGNLDTVELLNFVGVNNGFVSIWYDQSESSNDVVSITLSEQPRIVAAGTLETTNGLPAINFMIGVTATLINTGFSMPTNAHTSFAVVDAINTDVFHRRWLNVQNASDTLSFSHFASNVTTFLGQRTPSNSTVILPPATGSTQAYYMTNSTTYQEAAINQDSVTTRTDVIGHGTATKIKIGYHQDVLNEDLMWRGKVQEIIMYDFDNSANRVAIENNAFKYWKEV